ncbi:MAG: hypothetical protein ACREFP_09520, partial [Acetobacteraceae bacterium]
MIGLDQLRARCSMRIGCRAAVARLFGHDPTRLACRDWRFTAPVFPGDSIRAGFRGSGGGSRILGGVAGQIV